MYFLVVQILQSVEKSDSKHEHPLALLAEETKKLLKKDTTMFMPILSQRHPQATSVSASLLHRLYGNKLVSLYAPSLFFLNNENYIYLHFFHDTVVFQGGSGELNANVLFQKPFLGVAEHLTEDVISVFPAADNLEQYIMELIMSNCGEETADIYCRKLAPYQVIVGFFSTLHISFFSFSFLM